MAHDSEPPDYINGMEFTEQLSKCQVLKRGCVPWS